MRYFPNYFDKSNQILNEYILINYKYLNLLTREVDYRGTPKIFIHYCRGINF